MKQNLATWDKAFRAMGGAVMLAASVFAPWPLLVRILALGVGGVYMIGSALAGTCLGYKMMGISSCPITPGGKAT